VYAWLSARFPATAVDLFYVAWRGVLMVLIVLLADLPFGAFYYLNS
jgi:hypothetical protein